MTVVIANKVHSSVRRFSCQQSHQSRGIRARPFFGGNAIRTMPTGSRFRTVFFLAMQVSPAPRLDARRTPFACVACWNKYMSATLRQLDAVAPSWHCLKKKKKTKPLKLTIF